jgi:hypothetical protein
MISCRMCAHHEILLEDKMEEVEMCGQVALWRITESVQSLVGKREDLDVDVRILKGS